MAPNTDCTSRAQCDRALLTGLVKPIGNTIRIAEDDVTFMT